VIIGSGISGASAARYLREEENGKDLDIVMLEAREACWGATGRASLSQYSIKCMT
jgi:glycine/D-amino acid oxidase-like deaminating enzyme